MEIIDIGVFTIEVRDSKGYHSTVSQMEGRWYCLRCSRYRCEHALFVKQENPAFIDVPLSQEEIALIVDAD